MRNSVQGCRAKDIAAVERLHDASSQLKRGRAVLGCREQLHGRTVVDDCRAVATALSPLVELGKGYRGVGL